MAEQATGGEQGHSKQTKVKASKAENKANKVVKWMA